MKYGKLFRKFIETADKTVEMNHSQRCAQGVMDLANKTVVWGNSILPKAFYNCFETSYRLLQNSRQNHQ